MASLWKHPQSKYWVGCWTDATGHQRKRSTKETDKRRALEIARSWEETESMARDGYITTEAQFRTFFTTTYHRIFGKPMEPELTIRAWLERWLKNLQGTTSVRTVERYNQIIAKFLAYLDSRAELPLQGLSTENCIGYRDYLVSLGHSPGNANLTKKVLSQPFRQALAEGHVQRNPWAAVKTLQHDRAIKDCFTLEQIRKLLAIARNDSDWYGLILFGYYVGGRLTDLTRLSWAQIDLAQRLITFTQRKTARHGAKAVVRIPLHPELADYLANLPRPINNSKPVFPTLYHKPGSGKSGLSMAFKRLMQKAGIDAGVAKARPGKAGRSVSKLSFHSLRHTLTSAMANAGVPEEVRRKITGHASTQIHQIYTHIEIETVRTALASVGRLSEAA